MIDTHSHNAESFYTRMDLSLKLELPTNRETVLHFFRRLKKEFPEMVIMSKTPGGNIALEGNKDNDNESYRWVTIEQNLLSCGYINPSSAELALEYFYFVLEIYTYYLGIDPLEIVCLDLIYGFNFSFAGNHDEIIAESLFRDSPLSSILEMPGSLPQNFQPEVGITLSADCSRRARVQVLTRTVLEEMRTGQYPDSCISVEALVRQDFETGCPEKLTPVLQSMSGQLDTLCSQHVGPKILQAISTTISTHS